MGQEFKQAQLGSSQIQVVSLGVAGFKMAFSLPGLVPHQEKLEAGFTWPLSFSLWSQGPSPWFLWQSRQSSLRGVWPP